MIEAVNGAVEVAGPWTSSPASPAGRGHLTGHHEIDRITAVIKNNSAAAEESVPRAGERSGDPFKQAGRAVRLKER